MLVGAEVPDSDLGLAGARAMKILAVRKRRNWEV